MSETNKPTNQQTNKPLKALIALIAAFALCFCTACDPNGDSDDDTGSSTNTEQSGSSSDTGSTGGGSSSDSSSSGGISASDLSGTSWTGTLGYFSLAFEFTNDTLTVTVSDSIEVPCSYTISGQTITATSTDNTYAGSITMTVTSFSDSELVVTVVSSSGTFAIAMQEGDSLTLQRALTEEEHGNEQ